jgi:glutamine synthetase
MIFEYIWLDYNNNFRSKIRVMDEDNYSDWNFDGSSTNQATTESSEVILKVVASYNHPFIKGKLYLCGTYDINNNPLSNNYYDKANEIFLTKGLKLEPWFGLEQEYFIGDSQSNINNNSNIYYCSPINQDQDEVKIVNEHLEACINAGLKISGNNAEVVQHQWEFQIGPVEGIDAGHQLMVARYLLNRIAAKYNKYINYHPKPLNNVNGSGCHINFSTNAMREENGLDIIKDAIEKLKDNHAYHMKNYGIHNDKRMTGKHETADYNNFTWGIGSRNTSVRIGYETYKNKKGYFEDRRPASNINPYLATSIIFKTCCL